jgi:hypothetical protein
MDELRRALTTTTGGVENVIPEDLEPTLIEMLLKVSPLLALLPKKRADGKTHEVALRTAIPSAWVEGELATPNYTSSTYDRKSVQLKITRAAGGVSNFAQASAASFIDLLTQEINGSLEGIASTLEFLNMWGNTGDAYQYDGLDKLISEDGNVIDHDGVVTLALLDDMLDTIEQYRGVSRDRKIWVMSAQMLSKISGLNTRIGMDLDTLEFEDGFRMKAYRQIPIVTAPYVRPLSATTSPTVSAAAGAGTGTLATGTWRYKIASVTVDGEQVAGTADDVAVTGPDDVDLTWTADTNAKLYKIYRTAVNGADADANYSLLATISAKTYDSNGNVTANVASYTDTGALTLNTSVHPLAAGDETIWLIDIDEGRGASMLYLPNAQGNAAGQNWVRYLPLGRTRSSQDYLIETFTALQLPQPETCVVARRVSRS